MHFLRNVFAWVLASLFGYVMASSFSTCFVLADLAALGAEIPLGQWVSTIWSDIVGTHLYGVVIAAGFAVAFFIASLVKAMVPVLARVAYPVAGAAAVFTALSLIVMMTEIMPLGGARTQVGYLFQLFAGALGGFAFELLRPKVD